MASLRSIHLEDPVRASLVNTERSGFSVCFDDECGWLSDNASLETRSICCDLGGLGWSNVDDERTLGDLLTAERDRYDVLTHLLGVVAARECRLVHLQLIKLIHSPTVIAVVLSSLWRTTCLVIAVKRL